LDPLQRGLDLSGCEPDGFFSNLLPGNTFCTLPLESGIEKQNGFQRTRFGTRWKRGYLERAWNLIGGDVEGSGGEE